MVKTNNKTEAGLRNLIVAAAALAVLFGIAGPAQAQDYPTKPITLIVPFPAGGGVDAIGAHRRRKAVRARSAST